jgi:hypothetical protein
MGFIKNCGKNTEKYGKIQGWKNSGNSEIRGKIRNIMDLKSDSVY